MKLTRIGTFETNSSSCHSITVAHTGVYEGITPDKYNNVVIYPQEFGWEQAVRGDVLDRLAYVWTYIKDWSSSNEEPFMEMFQKVVCEHTGANAVIMARDESDYHPHGYIDHQSVEGGELNWLFKDEQTLKSFLFDRGSYVETDNDNH